ncbi:MAG: hypothetical protein QGH51_08340 [Planctomycetota bacterium]|jgi:hypothetical protein|nr:hypothetical protein [Planctomycetota bacterium]MDP6942016.1 hypothetical protein [Planctomycetota bacterium]
MTATLTLLLALFSFPQEPTGGGFDQEALDAKVAEISPRVAELRGLDFKQPVLAGVTTPDEFIEFAKKEFESEYGLENLNSMGKAYGLLGLMEPDRDLYQAFLEMLRGQVGGFYDPKTKKFYMMSTFNQGGLADIIMAHELTHALDDQYYYLDKMFENARDLNSDAEFALRAVVEGSGTSLMNLYTIQGMIAGYLKLDPANMNEMMASSADSIKDAPPFLVVTLALPYLEGNKFLVKQSSILAASAVTPKAEDLDYAFANPPLSSEQVLHFEKYWDPEKWDPPVEVVIPNLASVLPSGGVDYGMAFGGVFASILLMLVLGRGKPAVAGVAVFVVLSVTGMQLLDTDWKLKSEDTLGELGCFTLTAEDVPDLSTPEGQMGSWSNDASAGWGGDRYALWQNPGGDSVLVWATVWDTPEDCGEFIEAFHYMNDENPALVSVSEYESAAVMVFSEGVNAQVVDAVIAAVEAEHPEWK